MRKRAVGDEHTCLRAANAAAADAAPLLLPPLRGQSVSTTQRPQADAWGYLLTQLRCSSLVLRTTAKVGATNDEDPLFPTSPSSGFSTSPATAST